MEMEIAEDLEEPEHGWRLIEVRFDGLLGNEKQLVLNLDPDGTILTGQNGSGKSTILRAINCAQAEQTWHEFAELPLDGMSLKFEDGFEIRFEQGDERVVLKGGSSGEEVYEVPKPPRVLEAKQEPQFALWLSSFRWNRDPPGALHGEADCPAWASKLAKRLEVKLVRALRLESLGVRDAAEGSEGESAVDRIARMLEVLILYESSDFGRATNSQLYSGLRKSAIEALRAATSLERTSGASVDLADERRSLEREVQLLRNENVKLARSLEELGLLGEAAKNIADDVYDYDADIDGVGTLMVLKAIYGGERDAFASLEDVRVRLTQFREFANDRFSGKELVVDRDEGFRIALPNGEDIRRSELSSGEQHLLVLAYGLLFDTPSGSLVLIDEPELSLHVAWLQNLFTAFLEIGDQRDLQFIIATHSPAILVGYDEHQRSVDRLLS